MPQVSRRKPVPQVVVRPLYLGREPRRRVRARPAHEQHPFMSVQAAEPSMVSCGVFVVVFLFLVILLVFVLLKSGGWI